MNKSNNEEIERMEVVEKQVNDVEGDRIVDYFFIIILISNILYFIANNDMFTVYLLLQTINADEEFFAGIKHYDYDSIERQFTHAKEFYKKGQDEYIAKIKACLYYLYMNIDDNDNRPLKEFVEDKADIIDTILGVLIVTLNEFLYKANTLIRNDIEEKVSNVEIDKLFADIIYHNMKAEKLITKSKFEKLLK